MIGSTTRWSTATSPATACGRASPAGRRCNGWRGETDTPEKIQKRVECDLYYIENWSIFLDIYVLLTTPLALVMTKNAY